VTNDHRRRRTGNAGHVVVFGKPVAIEAEALGVTCKLGRVA